MSHSKYNPQNTSQAIRDIGTLREIGLRDIAEMKARFADPAAHAILPPTFNFDSFFKEKAEALETFLHDYEQGQKLGRYMCASLPSLPLDDLSFDLVVSSYLLFVYAPVTEGGVYSIQSSSGETPFDLPKTLASVEELARVCKNQLQIFPTHNFQKKDDSHPYLKEVVAKLESLGFECVLEKSTHIADTDKHNRLVATRRDVV